MELNLEVVLSSSIKRKKPWPRFCWLGQEKESVFLLDDKRISEINMVSGHTKKRTPKLYPLLTSVVTMSSSHNGLWLCGLLSSGELFLWNKDKDLLKTTTALPEVVWMITSSQGNPLKVSLQVSLDGMRVLLVTKTGQVFLWECQDVKDLTGLRDGPVKGHWAHIHSLENIMLPSSHDKEASQHTVFVKTEDMGDICLSAFVFTFRKKLIISFLKIQWDEGYIKDGSIGYSIQWTTKTYLMSRLTPPCQPVKSRGALVPSFSPDGKLLAIVLNQRKPKATQVLFVSTQNFVTISRDLGGCGSKKLEIPSKYIRSYWVGSVSWSPGGLFLACVLKRGSLLMLARLGGLLTLSTSGCNIDFGPGHFLPLHPLVTYRPPISVGKADASLSSSSLSVRDIMRQRYSVTWHPHLMYLIVSDGYLATVTRVLDRPSPELLLEALLKDIKVDLQKVSQKLDKLQVWLESVSPLNLDNSLEPFNSTVQTGPSTTDSIVSAAADGSTLPVFLRDQQTLGGTKELIESVQSVFEDESDVDGLPPGSHAKDGGCLEFASMFDTLHAIGSHSDIALAASTDCEQHSVDTEKKPILYRDLKKIQSRLLTAWAFSMSLGDAIMHRSRLLKHMLRSVVRFAALLHFMSSPVCAGGSNTSSKLFPMLRMILSFLPWDSSPSKGPRCLGLMVELSKQLMHLFLTPLPDNSHSCLSSQILAQALLALQLVSDSLDHTYNLQHRTYWSSAEKPTPQPAQLWFSDEFYVPLLQENNKKSSFVQPSKPVPQRPSSRLLGVYQMMYNVSKQYAEELKNFTGCDGYEEEEQQLTAIISQIQAAVQAAGERLEATAALLGYPGEHIFLCGSYTESVKMWQSQISGGSNKSCNRRAYQEIRYCLALLYSLLSQYDLKGAQELGDHMAQLLLHRAGHQDCPTVDSLPPSWLPMDLHSDAACAVVETLGRFMASYFTNQPLYIRPPHNITVLPSLHLPHDPSFGRLVPLCQEEVARAVRQQHLSHVWTVEYAQDLLLVGGLLPEAVWLASNLGDWKTAVSLSLAYTSYCKDHSKLSRLRRRELHLPSKMKPESIFQTELECLLCIEPESEECKDKDDDRSLMVELLDNEDWNVLRISIQEILKASVIAGVNIMSSPLSSLLDTAKEVCSSLPALVPTTLYLPSPPLYCPQPSPNTQDIMGTPGQLAEVSCRHKVSGTLQRLLLLLQSGHCCHPAAQWYISCLRRVRHLLHKIKTKYPYPSVPEVERTFPEGLMKFVTQSSYFRCGPNKHDNLDADTIQILICFRELCALCWMLHVRDQLSISCRKYHMARQRCRDEDVSADTEVNSACLEALRWACRFLPFSHFLNAEEILQDLLLSLISEVPPLPLVADTLVRAFPDEEESVRVPLREKYNSLLEKIRQCHVLEKETEESELMMILIQDKFRQRKKHLRRLQRHIAPPVLHLWEKEDEEEDRGSKHGMAMLRQLSLGTSLSTSSLTDSRFPPVCSDGDTAENTSEAISPEQQGRVKTRSKETNNIKEKVHAKKHAVETGNAMKEGQGDCKDHEQPSLPVVGTWEFELEDEEYLNFLELFLSYVLEKDSKDGGDSSNEPPFLRGFRSEIRERELHSLTFDVLTTIRRQRDGHHPARKYLGKDLPVFKAGCCFRPIDQDTTPELHPSSVCSEAQVSRISVPVTSEPVLSSGKRQGLFGLKKRSSVPSSQRVQNIYRSETIKSAFQTDQPSDISKCGNSVTVAAVTELQQGLDPKLEAQFPKLARLLEWMVRWADRRVLLGHHGKLKKEKRLQSADTVDEGILIRVKASAPAILTSLSLLEHRYATLLGMDHCSSHMQVPQVQCILAPVLQPAMDGPLERESSVDTGYPGSVQTPINAVDDSVQQEELSSGSGSAEPEAVTFHQTNLLTDRDQLMCDDEMRQSDSGDHRDVTSEQQVAGTEICAEDLEVFSSCSSENVSGNICTPDTSLKLAGLDCSVKSKEMSSSSSQHGSPGNLHTHRLQDVSASSIDQLKAPVSTKVSDSREKCLPNSTVNPVRDEAQTSKPVAPFVDSHVPNQPSASETLAVRQRLGEDLFRLIEHINYMSLRDVIHTSLSNVRSCSLAQSNAISSPHNGPSSTANSTPETNAPHIKTTVSESPKTEKYVAKSRSKKSQVHQTTDCLPTHQPEMQSSVKKSSPAHQFHTNRITLSSASGAGANYQEMQPLYVQAGSPECLLRESRNLIPCSEGLLATTDSNHMLPSASVLFPPCVSEQNNSAPIVPGLKLLQLQRPVLPQLSVPQCASTQPPQTQHTLNPRSIKTKQHKPKYNDKTTSVKIGRDKEAGLKRSSTFNASHHPTQRSSQPKFWPPDTIPSLQGLRLLRIHPELHMSLPKLHLGPSSRPTTENTSPLTETPLIKLLHINSVPKMQILNLTSSVQMPHPMSVEELTSSAIERQYAGDTLVQLLRVEPTNNSTTVATPASSLNSRKRRMKREKAMKAEVRFRPDATIIPTQEPADVPVTEQPTCVEATPSEEDISIPYEPPDSSLTGQELLDRAVITSAELHAFASMCKKPVEHRNASTETDFHLEFADKAVSAQISVPESSLNSHENVQIDNGKPTEDSKAVHEPERIQDAGGRQFLSVLDIKDTGYHQNLQPHPSSGPQESPPTCPSSLPWAELHYLAASAIISGSAAAPAGDTRPSPSIPEDVPTPNILPELQNPKESPSFSHTEPKIVSERSNFPLDHVTDDLSHSKVCQAIANQSTEPCRAFSFNTACFSSRLSELDAQLAVLQNIADNLEMDFSNSKLSIPHAVPDVSKTMTPKKTVRLSVPLTAWEPRPDPDPLTEMNIFEEDGENEELLEFDFCSTTSLHSHAAGPASLQTPPSKKDEIPETEDIEHAWPEENQSQSELSDTAVILGELVKEGYLSATDLDLTFLRTAPRSSKTEHSSHMPEEHHFSDDERREVRIWMRRKQRERLAVYQKHRKSLIEKEHMPFSSSSMVKSKDRNHNPTLRSKQQDKRLKLLERYNQRTDEACSLANNVLTTSAALQTFLQADSPRTAVTTKSISSTPPGNIRSVSGDHKKSLKSQSRQTEPHSRPHSAEVHWQRSDDYRTRLGLHRPASVLPKDRLSQVTKRGMLPGTKAQSEQFSVGHQKKMELNRTFLKRAAVSGRTPK